MVIWVQPVLRRGKGPQEAAAASLEEPRAHNAEERVTEGGLQVVSMHLAWLWPLSPVRMMWSPDARLFAHSITPFSQRLLILQSLASSQSQGHRSSQGPDWVSLLVDLVGFSGEVSVGRWGRTHQAQAVLWGQSWSFVLPTSQSHAEASMLESSGSCPGFLPLCPLLATLTTRCHTTPFPRCQMLHNESPRTSGSPQRTLGCSSFCRSGVQEGLPGQFWLGVLLWGCSQMTAGAAGGWTGLPTPT